MPGMDRSFDHDSRIEDGYIILGDTPGNGIQFDMEKLEQYPGDGAVSQRGAESLGKTAWRGLVPGWRGRAGGSGGGVWGFG